MQVTEGIRWSGAGVTGSCEPPDVGAEHQAEVPEIHLSSPEGFLTLLNIGHTASHIIYNLCPNEAYLTYAVSLLRYLFHSGFLALTKLLFAVLNSILRIYLRGILNLKPTKSIKM